MKQYTTMEINTMLTEDMTDKEALELSEESWIKTSDEILRLNDAINIISAGLYICGITKQHKEAFDELLRDVLLKRLLQELKQ